MSKRKEIIQLFDSISKFNTYSKYSNSLKKIFKNQSLKEYIKSLKNPIHIDTFQFITDFDKRTKKMEEEDDFNLYPKGYNKKGKQLDLLHEESIQEEQEQTPENKEITKKTLFKNKSVNNALLYRQDGLDPFKYNPNYNSIYKNVPSFRYIQEKNSSNKKIIKNRTSLFNINKNKKIQNIKKMNIKINTNNINFNDIQDFENEKNSEKYEYLNIASDKNIKSRNSKTLPMLNTFTLKSKNQKKRSKLKNFKSCDNHAFRFSKYIPRKMNIYKVNSRLTYLEPHCYFSSDKNNKAIDFNKMEYRNSNRWIDLGRVTNPSFYNYNPNYDSIEKHRVKIFFNHKDYEKKIKKTLLKKYGLHMM